MKIKENISLAHYTTLRLGGLVSFLVVVSNETDLVCAVQLSRLKNIPILPLGGGSNLIVLDKFKDIMVLKMENKGIKIIREDADSVDIRVGAGHIWDNFVQFTVENKYSGIEALSMIPGTCGATPVQNVGAYGQEVSNTIKRVKIYDFEKSDFREIEVEDCCFSYRSSIFKNELKGKCIIVSVVYTLLKSAPKIPDYPKVSSVLAEIRFQNPNESVNQSLRKTIQKIRSEKLPNPLKIPNVGSFFKNPFIKKELLQRLLNKFPDIPYFLCGDTYKIPAGWLIEKAGYNGYIENGVGVYESNALVLVNLSTHSSRVLMDLAEKIQNIVQDVFEIQLEIEPEVI